MPGRTRRAGKEARPKPLFRSTASAKICARRRVRGVPSPGTARGRRSRSCPRLGRTSPAGAACLLIHPCEVLSADWLVHQLWPTGNGDRAGALQVAMSRLRKALGNPTPVLTRASGYLLEIEPEQSDAACFALAHAEGSRLLAA